MRTIKIYPPSQLPDRKRKVMIMIHGYEHNKSQVTSNIKHKQFDKEINFSYAKLEYIKPQPTQILIVFQLPQNEDSVHIDLDSEASLNYTEEREALKRGFKNLQNGQMSKLGEGLTRIKACGELNETFFRNKKKIKQAGAELCQTQLPTEILLNCSVIVLAE